MIFYRRLDVPFAPEVNQIKPLAQFLAQQQRREILGDGLLEVLGGGNTLLVSNFALTQHAAARGWIRYFQCPPNSMYICFPSGQNSLVNC